MSLIHPIIQSAETQLNEALLRFMKTVTEQTSITHPQLLEWWSQALSQEEPKKKDIKQELKNEIKAELKKEPKKDEPKKEEPKKEEPKKEEPKKEEDVKSRCIHLMVRGKNEGKECGNPSKSGTSYCTKHQTAVKDEKKILIEEEEIVKAPTLVLEKVCVVKELEQKKADFEADTVMTVEEAKRLDFRVKQREFNLSNKKYDTFEVEKNEDHYMIKGTNIVVSEKGEEILGYLNDKEVLIRGPNRATDRAVIEYGIPFNGDGLEIDE